MKVGDTVEAWFDYNSRHCYSRSVKLIWKDWCDNFYGTFDWMGSEGLACVWKSFDDINGDILGEVENFREILKAIPIKEAPQVYEG
jgi:hypothetical protein